jgi:uncharacterized protein
LYPSRNDNAREDSKTLDHSPASGNFPIPTCLFERSEKSLVITAICPPGRLLTIILQKVSVVRILIFAIDCDTRTEYIKSMGMAVGILTLHLYLPGCTSLKNKRSRLKPFLARLHREFNVSAAEIDFQDQWNEAIIACTIVSNNKVHDQQVLQEIIKYTETHFDDLQVVNQDIELI